MMRLAQKQKKSFQGTVKNGALFNNTIPDKSSPDKKTPARVWSG